MQHKIFHISTKERRNKVAKKEERKYIAAAAHKPVNFFQDATAMDPYRFKFWNLNLFRI
jgi:hypothetical protein